MSLKYLNRTLTRCHVWYALCLTEAEWRREMRRLGQVPEKHGEFPKGRVHAITFMFTDKRGRRRALIAFNTKAHRTELSVISTLVHEAVHVWQDEQNHIGERKTSDEHEAYSIESIAMNLIRAYRRAA